MQTEIKKIIETLSQINEENSAADNIRYLRTEDFLPEYRELIAAINKTIETGDTRIKQERNSLEIINEIICSGMWSMSFDEKGKMTKVTWSQAFRNMIGFQNLQDFPDTLEAWSSRLHPEDQQATLGAYWEAIAGRQVYNVEYRLLTKTEGYKWFCATGEVARRTDGSPSLFIGTFIDISQKKENEQLTREKQAAQEALANTQRDIEETLAGAKIGIWSVEFEDGCQPRMYADKMMKDLLGVRADISLEDCYQRWLCGIEPGYVEMVHKTIKEVRENGHSEIIYPWNHPVSGRIYVRCGMVPDLQFKKTGYRLKGYHQDITETMISRQKQDKALLDAVVEAKQANLAKTEFLSHISHDIRTPINGILGMVTIGDKNPGDFERQRESRAKIRVAAEHLLSLINDVLDVSKLESGSFHFAEEEFQLDNVLNSCMQIVGSQAEEQNITLELDCGRVEHRELIGSPLHLRQILINILGNAVKYNRPKGRAVLYVKELSSQNDNAVFQFEIADNGIGMGKEFQKHLFEPFTQENSDARTSYKGSGLGMAITHSLVSQMGGTLSVESEQGEGSRFTVVLPLRISDRQTLKQQKETAPVSISGMKVLLVEDNELNREIAQYLLEDAGVTVRNAENGRQCVAVFSASQPGEFDCILMDVMMPVMSGLEAAAIIRKLDRPDSGTIPIIALSANAFAEDIQKSKDAGMNEHLAKPLDFEKLFCIMASYRREDSSGVG